MDISVLSSLVTEKLLVLECPFLWKLRNDLEICPDDMIDSIVSRIEPNAAETSVGFEMIVSQIVLGYEYYLVGNVIDALKSLETAETELMFALSDGLNHLFLKKVSTPLLYIIWASKAHVLVHKNELQEAYDVILEIPVIPPTDATLIGLRALFYAQYGICGLKMGVLYAAKAIEKNPEESLWYFLKGRYMESIRCIEDYFAIPTQEEIELLEKAVQLEESVTYMLNCAIVYQTTVRSITRTHSKEPEIIKSLQPRLDELNSESLKLIKKSIELEPNSVPVIFRCAKCLLMLPWKFRDDVECKKLLERGLDLVPDYGYGNHLMAIYYERREKNYKLAVQHLKICEACGIFGAALDRLRLEYQMDETTVDVVARLNQLFKDHPENRDRRQVLCQLASYYIFAVPDLAKACKYIGAYLRLVSTYGDFHYHRSLFAIMLEPVNLFDVVIDEIKIRLRDHVCPAEERETYQKLLNEFHEIGVDIPAQVPQNLKQSILDKSNASKIRFQRFQGGPESESQYSRRPVSTAQSTTPVLSWRRRP